MITTSTTGVVEFTPPWFEGRPSAPKYFLRGGSVIERGMMQAELAGPHRAAEIFGFELRQAEREGVSALLADDPELDRVLGLFEQEAQLAIAAAEGSDVEPLAGDDAKLLERVREILAEHWPDYGDLVAQAERRRQIAPIVALKRYCTGWENVTDLQGKPLPFARGRDGQVADGALGRLPPLEMTAAGSRAYNLQFGLGEEGNSSRPSTSGDGQPTSGSDASSTEAGTSPADAGEKTPA